MQQPERASRPQAHHLEPAKSTSANGSLPSIPRATDVLADLDAVAEHLRAYLVLQVTVDDEGHRRTQVYRSAAAVERAVKRATERGRQAHVTLCQLLPVGVVSSLTRAAPRPADLAECVWCGGVTSSTDSEPMHPICAAAHAVRGEAS